jgi:hypothetical protein
MQTECSAKPSELAPVEGRPVVAGFERGAVTSDAGGLRLGAADKAIGLVRRLAGCFRDARDSRLIQHTAATLVGRRVFGIALGYEDLNDHDHLRLDPAMSVLAGKLEAWRSGYALPPSSRRRRILIPIFVSPSSTRLHIKRGVVIGREKGSRL